MFEAKSDGCLLIVNNDGGRLTGVDSSVSNTVKFGSLLLDLLYTWEGRASVVDFCEVPVSASLGEVPKSKLELVVVKKKKRQVQR